MNVSDVGEFGLITLLAREFGIEYPPKRGHSMPGLLVPLGDDAVVTEPRSSAVIWTTDTMVQGEHFRSEYSDWQDVGWRSLASNVSDIAAMGGEPYLALITLQVPRDLAVDNVRDLYRGLHECATAFGVTLGGGDIVRSPVFAVTVALSGWAYAPRLGRPVVLRRDTAQPGDLVAVTGTPGDSGGGLKLLVEGRSATTEAENHLLRAHNRPVPRIGAGAAAVRVGLRCGIDISDGLVQDLGHIANASGVEIVVESDRVPVSDALREVWPEQALELALGGGEDYELAIIGPRAAMERYASTSENGVTVIGEVIPADRPKVRVLDADGVDMEVVRRGWDHFTSS